jgi:hypothetical protein
MYESLADAVGKDRGEGAWLLLKVGERQHLERLADGALRFRRLSYYRKTENRGKAMFDAEEGLIAIYQPPLTEVTIGLPGIGARPIRLAGPLTLRSNAPHSIFCLFTLEPGEWEERGVTAAELPNMLADITIPRSMEKHGDSVWVILNVEKFLDRVRTAFRHRGLASCGRKVSYVGLTQIHGRVPDDQIGFVKGATFRHEREYRIRIDPLRALPDPFILRVGSLRDISKVLSLKAFQEGLSIHLPA